MTNWQPIDTAPKEGEIIVCGRYSDDIALVRWDENAKDWICMADGYAVLSSQTDFGSDYRYFSVPSHWQPAPRPLRSRRDDE